MKLEIVVILAVLALASARLHRSKSAQRLASENGKLGMYDGKKTTIKKFPYMVSITFGGLQWCAGNILNSHWILTTAWCLYDQTPGDFFVVAGSTNGVSGHQTFGVKQIVDHPYFYISSMDYDFACVEIDGKFKWTTLVKPVKLPSNQPSLNTTLTVAGWGTTLRGSSDSVSLRQGQMQWVNQSICEQYFTGEYTLTPRMACAYNPGKTTLCIGDEGDPFEKNGTIYGLHSIAQENGEFCGSSAWPVIVSNVHTVIPWIRKTIKYTLGSH